MDEFDLGNVFQVARDRRSGEGVGGMKGCGVIKPHTTICVL